MTKSELIDRVAEDRQIPRAQAELAVNAIFDSMVRAMCRGEGIEIRGFGSFSVRQYKAYEGRNPKTGEIVSVAPKRLPFFKVGKELRERINAGPPPEPESSLSVEASKSATGRNSKRRGDHKISEDCI